MSILTDLLTEIADAIRTKKGTTETIVATDFPTEILNLSTESVNTVIIPFGESVFPTTWSNNEGTNDIGTFKASASTTNSSSYVASNAFDSDTSSCWRPADTGTYEYVQIALPENISICPSTILARYQRVVAEDTTGYFQGYNPETESWENLFTFTRNSAVTEETKSVTTSNFYTKFRTYARSYADSKNYLQYIYNLQITAGKIKVG